MVEKKVKFMSAGQIMTFCNTCQKLKSDVDVTDMANRNYIIDGKSLMGLMSIKLGLPMRVVVNGMKKRQMNVFLTMSLNNRAEKKRRSVCK